MRAPLPSLTLRERIAESMDDIIDIIKGERGWGPAASDPRRRIITFLGLIASLEPQASPAELRDQYDKIKRRAKALRDAVEGTRYGHLVEGLDRTIADSSARAKAARRKVRPSGGASTDQKDEAAELAYDLLNEQGCQVPTLTSTGAYVSLAYLLYAVATGEDEDLKGACARVFERLHDEVGPTRRPEMMPNWPYAPRGRKRKPVPRSESAEQSELGKIMQADVAEHRRRIDEAIRRTPLDQLLDKMLG
jgi:hypothetical protein